MPAYPIGEKINDPLAMYLCDVYTACTNLAGIAGLSIPCGFSSRGLPIGLHLQAPAFEEEAPAAGSRHAHRCATAWHTRRPSLDGE